MKHFFTLALTAFMMFATLSACGCDRGGNADLVFVNDSNTTIAAVVVDFAGQTSGTQHADSSPLKRGESFGFEASQTGDI